MKELVAQNLQSKASQTTAKGLGRAEEILVHARQLLVRQGSAGLSLRALAQSVGMSLSNLQHYFPGREALLQSLVRVTLVRYQQGVDAQLRAHAQHGAERQLDAVLEYLLRDLDDATSRGFLLALWDMAEREQFAAALHSEFQRRAIGVIAAVLRDVGPARSEALRRRVAVQMLACIQGMATAAHNSALRRARARRDLHELLMAVALGHAWGVMA
ncbi:TetR/AcrR family transcriptional regulator [Roseateles sp. BYS180W]|uniref:TetR/AcrR family transcriptional regulator n=1 Tax=Roseateles rivi TaxID=3299028 RepID=A0ABW7FX21_9BURK